jgi:hypothetical protein
MKETVPLKVKYFIHPKNIKRLLQMGTLQQMLLITEMKKCAHKRKSFLQLSLVAEF